MAERRTPDPPPTTRWEVVAIAWLIVTLPLLWGIGETIKKAAALFR